MYQESELFKVNEVCQILKINRITLARWQKARKINVIRLPLGGIRISGKEINRLTQELETS